jgi:poly(3-hydroxybutyrate) depolymerase
LNDTLSRLSALRDNVLPDGTGAPGKDRLSDLPAFGSNPGALRARFYVPRATDKSSALVVVLHGCTQDAASYDHGSGWSRLADEQGFALLFPEQQRGNNANLCFNWFNAGDTRRDSGEALSIRQMVAAMVAGHGIDPARIFVTGLSAGGAMASVMLPIPTCLPAARSSPVFLMARLRRSPRRSTACGRMADLRRERLARW